MCRLRRLNRSLGPQIIITSKPRSGRKRIRASDAHSFSMRLLLAILLSHAAAESVGLNRCVDSDTWHKRGDPTKDCERPVSTSSRRVLAGSSGNFARSGRDSGISPLSPSASKRFVASQVSGSRSGRSAAPSRAPTTRKRSRRRPVAAPARTSATRRQRTSRTSKSGAARKDFGTASTRS